MFLGYGFIQPNSEDDIVLVRVNIELNKDIIPKLAEKEKWLKQLEEQYRGDFVFRIHPDL